MRKPFVAIVMMIAVALGVQAADLTVKSPDGRIEVEYRRLPAGLLMP